jgi:hypothetical protein
MQCEFSTLKMTILITVSLCVLVCKSAGQVGSLVVPVATATAACEVLLRLQAG